MDAKKYSIVEDKLYTAPCQLQRGTWQNAENAENAENEFELYYSSSKWRELNQYKDVHDGYAADYICLSIIESFKSVKILTGASKVQFGNKGGITLQRAPRCNAKPWKSAYTNFLARDWTTVLIPVRLVS